MSRILILTPRLEDGRALQDLLASDEHTVELRSLTAGVAAALTTSPPDVILADAEPWTWTGRAILEHWRDSGQTPRIVMVGCRPVAEPPSPGCRYLRKPIDISELRRAMDGLAPSPVNQVAA
jgi:DNA-binding response OmpR family regulator